MTDWSSGSATIHACPPYRVRTVLRTLQDYGLIDTDIASSRTLHLGRRHDSDEIARDSITDLAHSLIQKAPEVAFTVYEEPDRHENGTICLHVPELGLYTAACDIFGNPTFTCADVVDMLSVPLGQRQHRLGLPWRRAIDALPTGPVDQQDTFAVEWNRSRSEIIVVEGLECGGDLILARPASTTMAVEAILATHGHRIVENSWTPADDTGNRMRAESYRYPRPTGFDAQIAWWIDDSSDPREAATRLLNLIKDSPSVPVILTDQHGRKFRVNLAAQPGDDVDLLPTACPDPNAAPL
ncbi:hypothetical protein NQK81_01575 [Amycolatopsis roodepoortensis]|uniref:hypothetical protein n=1 Tax=Amycolatopsis roodepoortensis TaxID=700274 RepID=UPI00214BF102|nr:hypothetical protein [Amycolatopsis roodepoortensis]UUV32166.1 hypothetical protein NQK81_01575 [Amycolatopsis roodepoortensis]